MFGHICHECKGKLGRIELDPTRFVYYCPACDHEYREDEADIGHYHLDEVSRELESGDTLLVRLEGGRLYVGIIRTPEGYVLDVHNGSELLKDPDGNDLTMSVWEDDWNEVSEDD